MYFSMQLVKHVSSPFESEVPGLGTHRSKQCSFSFSTSMRAFCMAASCWIWRMICVLLKSHQHAVDVRTKKAKRRTGHWGRQTCRSRLMSPFCRMCDGCRCGDGGRFYLMRYGLRCSFSKKLSTSRAPVWRTWTFSAALRNHGTRLDPCSSAERPLITTAASNHPPLRNYSSTLACPFFPFSQLHHTAARPLHSPIEAQSSFILFCDPSFSRGGSLGIAGPSTGRAHCTTMVFAKSWTGLCLLAGSLTGAMARSGGLREDPNIKAISVSWPDCRKLGG